MVNTSIADTTPDGHRNFIGRSHRGGFSSQISKEKEVASIISDNQIR